MAKVKYGLKNVHYAKINEDQSGNITFGTPKKIPGAVNITVSPVGEASEFNADDDIYFGEEVNGGYDGSLEVAMIPDEFRKEILGDVEDEDGSLVEVKDAITSNFALLFEFSQDKTSRKIRHCFYNVQAVRPNVDGSTKTKTIEPKTDVLNIKVRPSLKDGAVKKKSNDSTTQEAYDNWFEKVPEFTKKLVQG